MPVLAGKGGGNSTPRPPFQTPMIHSPLLQKISIKPWQIVYKFSSTFQIIWAFEGEEPFHLHNLLEELQRRQVQIWNEIEFIFILSNVATVKAA